MRGVVVIGTLVLINTT